jgi:hypothetical protein
MDEGDKTMVNNLLLLIAKLSTFWPTCYLFNFYIATLQDCLVMSNIQSFLSDPALWDQPDLFNPHRQLQPTAMLRPSD